jgi:PAS domain S-box-containing protein
LNERPLNADQLRDRISLLEDEIEELKSREAHYQELVDNALEGVWSVDSKWRTNFVNKRMADMLGYTPEEMIGRPITDFMNSSEKARAREIIQDRPDQEGEVYHFDLLRSDGDSFQARIAASLLQDQDGQFTGAMALVSDISESKRAEASLKEMAARNEEEKQRLLTVLSTLPVGVVIVNKEGQVQQSNERAKDIWGPVTQLKPRSVKDYRSLKGWWADTGIPLKAEYWTVTRALRENKTIIGDMIDIERTDGTRGCILNSAAPLHHDDKLVGGVVVTEDISQQRKLEHEAIAAKEQGELYIDLLTHDINNMTAAAKGYLELVQEKSTLDHNGQKRLAKCLACLDDISGLIGKVKKIQKIEGPDAKLEKVDLGWIIEDVILSFGDVPGREVSINYQPRLKRMVMASELITDVFSNLVGNAIKHSEGPVNIDISLGRTFKEGREFYQVSVEDNGPGIPDDAKKRIFSRLQRGRTKATGSGLGLYLVSRLVEEYRGQIWVEDRVRGDPTKGSRFVVLLPAATSVESE